MGGHEGKYADLLTTLLAESGAWPATASDPNWTTFAGNAERNRIAARLADVGAVSWRIPLRATTASASDRLFEPRTTSENPREPLSFHPLQVGNMVLVNNSERILAVRLDTGQPVWGREVIYESQLSGLVPPPLPPELLGSPRFSLTVFTTNSSPAWARP